MALPLALGLLDVQASSFTEALAIALQRSPEMPYTDYESASRLETGPETRGPDPLTGAGSGSLKGSLNAAGMNSTQNPDPSLTGEESKISNPPVGGSSGAQKPSQHQFAGKNVRRRRGGKWSHRCLSYHASPASLFFLGAKTPGTSAYNLRHPRGIC